jgi:hypothetical protein
LQDHAADLDQIERSRAELARSEQEVRARRQELEGQERELAEQEMRLAELDEKLASQASELEARGAQLDVHEEARPPALAEEAAAVERSAAEGAVRSSWSLGDLGRLVEDNASDHPELIDEWRYYLLYLREFAGPGGGLPASFDALVAEAFGDLLRAA